MINKDSSVNNMRRLFHKSKHQSLFDDGLMKVKQGLTTIEEVLRVAEACSEIQEAAPNEDVNQDQ